MWESQDFEGNLLQVSGALVAGERGKSLRVKKGGFYRGPVLERVGQYSPLPSSRPGPLERGYEKKT